MSRQSLLDLLRQRIGLDAGSLGERVLDDAFAEARASLGVADDEALYGKALVHPQAFAEIVERFVVPESWFFRAGDQYADLVRFAREQRERRPLRVLSLPCASGEEAYSAVIALVESGMPPGDIDVLGIDVSQAAIERARAGVFRNNALRGQPMPDIWTHARTGGFAIADGIRQCARFRVGNALDPRLMEPGETFDVVFCRNLLIYLHPQARDRLLKTLLAALAPGGLLLAGQAETLNALSNELSPYEGGCPLSYVRVPAPSADDIRQSAIVSYVAPAEPAARSKAAPRPAAQPPTPTPIVELSPQALADAGRLEEARNACRLHLQRHPENIETLFLLGLVESARGDLAAADEAFARVCYLDRNHLPAMDHRIALAERLGRLDVADDLRHRRQRMNKRLARQA
jgi:chemotaxis protein methyltransferase WspC